MLFSPIHRPATSGRAPVENGATSRFSYDASGQRFLRREPDGSGGTIQNISGRGASFISANNISLSNMTFTLVGTTNGADPNVATSGCGDLVSGNNLSCNAGIHVQTVTGATFTNVDMNNNSGGNSSGQIGINGDNVTNFVLSNSNVLNFGNECPVKYSSEKRANSLIFALSLARSVLAALLPTQTFPRLYKVSLPIFWHP